MRCFVELTDEYYFLIMGKVYPLDDLGFFTDEDNDKILGSSDRTP